MSHAFADTDHALSHALMRRGIATPGTTLARLADALDSQRDELILSASAETALTPAELAPEFDRTTGTLRLFSDLVRSRDWTRPAINLADTFPRIGPPHEIRSWLMPLGDVVAVFGASNFPLAYGVFGGDTASALAAGCAVVVKEHPAQPRTGRLCAAIAARVGAPVTYLLHEDPRDFSVAKSIVSHPSVCAVGFTGSVAGGLAIDALARQRPNPIPVFAEMGAANSVIITPAAAKGRDIGVMLGESIMARHGQQCTKPGLIFVPRGSSALITALSTIVQRTPTRDMLAPWVRDAYLARARACQAARSVTPLVPLREPAATRDASPILVSVSMQDWSTQPVLHDEIFGPAAIIIEYEDVERILDAPIPNALTTTLHGALPAELPLARRLATFLAARAGRFIFAGVPTGVRVADAMVHGGPFPATNRPESTAVGPRAIERWCRPVCFQNVPTELLPTTRPA